MVRAPCQTTSEVTVEFSITLSPVYEVPVLWFTFQSIPSSGPQGIDAVYEYLVPRQRESGLRQVGVMGAISMAVWDPLSTKTNKSLILL